MANSFTKKFIVSSLFFFILPGLAAAQINMGVGSTLESELSAEVIPAYPKANQRATIQLEMYTEDLDKAEITWNQDNKILIKENGKKTFSFVAPKSGAETTIEVRVKLQSGTTFYKSFTIRPMSVDLIWQSDSYVPPFYKGKALHPKQGNLRIVAMPDFRDSSGKQIPANNLIYKWSDGNNVYDTESGYGKNVLNIESSILGRNNRIELLVTNPKNNTTASEILDINTTSPEVLFYEISPFYGALFNKALPTTVNLNSEEIEVLAAPFFVSGINNNTTSLSWRLNSQSSSELNDSRTVVFRKPEDQSGISNIQLELANPGKILQATRASFNINFQN